MPNSPEFVEHAVELLSGLGPVDVRAMFGGHGVYARGIMFGLLDGDELFLKTDELSRPAFVDAGCRQWVYATRTGRREDTSWFRPPDDAHEDHLAVGALLERIREATDGFAVPEWGCNTYRVTMRELDALEADVLRHVHLENHVLMPRVLAR